MIAHSFKGEVFGPAQALHRAIFTVAAFMSEKLDPNGIVVDIGCAIDAEGDAKVVNYKNPTKRGVQRSTPRPNG
jgi:hypothetical protein